MLLLLVLFLLLLRLIFLRLFSSFLSLLYWAWWTTEAIVVAALAYIFAFVANIDLFAVVFIVAVASILCTFV